MLKKILLKNERLIKKLIFILFLIASGISTILAIKFALNNTEVYRNGSDSSLMLGLQYLVGTYVVFFLPGIIFALYTNFNKLVGTTISIFSIIPSSILYWILVSVLYFNIFKSFDYSVILVGSVLLTLCVLWSVVKNKTLFPGFIPETPWLYTFKKYVIYLALIIPMAIAFYTSYNAFHEYPQLPNYDAQTHAQIISNVLHTNDLDIQKNFGNSTGFYKEQSFYPIAYHVIVSLVGLITGDFAPTLARNVTTILITFIPLITAGTIYLFKRKKSLAVIAGFFSIAFFWLPYKPLTWGGAPLVMSLIIGAYIAGLSYYLIKKYQFRNSTSNMLIILSNILLILIHPSSFITYVILLLALCYKEVFAFLKKPSIKHIAISIVFSLVLVALIFLPDITTLNILYKAQITDKTAVIVENKSDIHPTMLVKSLVIFENYWFEGGSHTTFGLFAAGLIYCLIRFNKNRFYRGFSIFFFVLLLTNALIAGTQNIPIISNYTNIWFNNYQRLLYAMYLPVIFFISLAIYQFLREVKKLKALENLSTLNKYLLVFLAFGTILLLTTSDTSDTIKKTVKNYQLTSEEFEALNFLANQKEDGVVIGFPSDDFNHQKNLDWINTYTPDIDTYIDRATHLISSDERVQRSQVVLDLEAGTKDLCKLSTYKQTKRFDIEYVYVTNAPHFPGDPRNTPEGLEEKFDRAIQLVQNSGCAELIYQTEKIYIYTLN